MAYNAAFKYGKKIAIFSLEMSKEELFGRLLSMRARVDGHRLRMSWLLEPGELERIEQAKGDLRSDCIFIDETPSLTTALLRSKARRLLDSPPHEVSSQCPQSNQRTQSDPGSEANFHPWSPLISDSAGAVFLAPLSGSLVGDHP